MLYRKDPAGVYLPADAQDLREAVLGFPELLFDLNGTKVASAWSRTMYRSERNLRPMSIMGFSSANRHGPDNWRWRALKKMGMAANQAEAEREIDRVLREAGYILA